MLEAERCGHMYNLQLLNNVRVDWRCNISGCPMYVGQKCSIADVRRSKDTTLIEYLSELPSLVLLFTKLSRTFQCKGFLLSSVYLLVVLIQDTLTRHLAWILIFLQRVYISEDIGN